jgi:acylphosphatase
MGKLFKLTRLFGFLLCLVVFLGGANLAYCADDIFVIAGSSSSSDIAQLKTAVATLQSQVATLQGKIFPYGLVNMYEDSTVKIVLTGESKTVTDLVNHYTNVALRLLITNKTANTIYIGYEYNTSNVVDENGKGESNRALSGIEGVYGDSSNGNYFSAIGPKSSLTVNWVSSDYRTIFYSSHYLTASFGFVLFGNTANTRFNAGFTGIHLP